jgi:hypothetical protein
VRFSKRPSTIRQNGQGTDQWGRSRHERPSPMEMHAAQRDCPDRDIIRDNLFAELV